MVGYHPWIPWMDMEKLIEFAIDSIVNLQKKKHHTARQAPGITSGKYLGSVPNHAAELNGRVEVL